MIGLSILGVLLLVTVLTIWIFISVIKRAKRKGKNPYLHGGIAAIILFILITWDWIPSEIYYAYQCKQLPPMQVYKTPEQWIAENQDLIKSKDVEFKINNKKDLPQVSKEGYPLTIESIDKWFVYLEYSTKNDRFLRTDFTKSQVLDRYTGNTLLEIIIFKKVQWFFSPPELGGRKYCFFGINTRKKYSDLEMQFKEISK